MYCICFNLQTTTGQVYIFRPQQDMFPSSDLYRTSLYFQTTTGYVYIFRPQQDMFPSSDHYRTRLYFQTTTGYVSIFRPLQNMQSWARLIFFLTCHHITPFSQCLTTVFFLPFSKLLAETIMVFL